MDKHNNATVIKSLNNSCVLVKHDNKQKIFLGKGIGFLKRKGDKLEFDGVEKIFVEEN